MKSILISVNTIIIVLIIAYLTNLFSIAELGINALGLVFASSLAITLLSHYLVEEYNISNALFFILPALASVLISVLAVKALSIITIIGVLFLLPGITLLLKRIK
ncbi:MAG: hypothetical protein NZ903_02485 [Candidatus Micrarchaeota archaeon]|nr:hypothetical protein [Candidatus Micrarchaeota archaeon]